MPKLDGKVALVTGGTSGIGLAAATALAKEGAYVYITGRRERELAAAVQQIGRSATGVRGDVSNAQDLDRLLAQIRNEKGRLDILFANAGIARYAALGNITEELYDSIFRSVVVFRRIPGKRTARPGLNGEQLQAVVSDWQWLAPKRRGEAVLRDPGLMPSPQLFEKRHPRLLQDRQIHRRDGHR
jgi:NAD(P)-dependent dehydrogenase (short-subunit alcohol dehydrogenase family)